MGEETMVIEGWMGKLVMERTHQRLFVGWIVVELLRCPVGGQLFVAMQ